MIFIKSIMLLQPSLNLTIIIFAMSCQQLAPTLAGKIECGQSTQGEIASNHYKSILSTRVFGDRFANPGELPFQAAIYSNNSGFHCNGVIIGEKTILSNTKCLIASMPEVCLSFNMTGIQELQRLLAKEFTVRVGERDLESDDGQQEFDVDKVILSMEFCKQSQSRITADIAILRLKGKLSWRLTEGGYGSVNRICLPRRNIDYNAGQKVFVSSWGEVDHSIRSSILKLAKLKIINREDCSRFYENDDDIEFIDEGQLCTSQWKNHSLGSGDEGGPLFRKLGKTERMELVGIASFGWRLASQEKNNPNGFTRVSYYLDWIQQQLMNESGNKSRSLGNYQLV